MDEFQKNGLKSINSQNRWSGNIKVYLLLNTSLFPASIFYQLKSTKTNLIILLFYSQFSFEFNVFLFCFVLWFVCEVPGPQCEAAQRCGPRGKWIKTCKKKIITKDRLHWTKLSSYEDTGSFSRHTFNIYYNKFPDKKSHTPLHK